MDIRITHDNDNNAMAIIRFNPHSTDMKEFIIKDVDDVVEGSREFRDYFKDDDVAEELLLSVINILNII